jgi:hypothetical protein
MAASHWLSGKRNSCCPKTDRRGSCGLPTVVVEHPAEARATGDPAVCPVVIRRSNLLSDELATKPFDRKSLLGVLARVLGE